MKLFISYGHDKYKDLIEKLANDLKSLGYDIWIDFERLYERSVWTEEIERGIESSDITIVFMTSHSMRRPDGYCLNEIAFASYCKKEILPVRIEDVPPPISIARIQWLDLSTLLNSKDFEKDYNDYLLKLDKVIKHEIFLEENLNYSNNLLEKILQPLDNETFLGSKDFNFCGRRWLLDKYDLWINDVNSRLFVLLGEPGSGKTEIAKYLSNTQKNISGVHFCKFDNLDRSNPKKVIMSLAFHLATQIEEYKDILLKSLQLCNISQIDDISRLFSLLFIEPLSKLNIKQTHVLIIDALDETFNNGESKLANVLAKEFIKTPSWLKLFLTARPEVGITNRFKTYNPIVLNGNSKENINDLHEYLQTCIGELISDESIFIKIIEKSKGNFLYVSEIAKAINHNPSILSDLDSLPDGMINVYLDYLERLTSTNQDLDYKDQIKPLIEIIICYLDKLPLDELQQISNFDDYIFERIINSLITLFPNDGEFINVLHKSLADFLFDSQLSNEYYISKKTGNKRISLYYIDKVMNKECYDQYSCKFLISHLINANLSEELHKIILNNNFITEMFSLLDEFDALDNYIVALEFIAKNNHKAIKEILSSQLFIKILTKYKSFFISTGKLKMLKKFGFADVIDSYMTLGNNELFSIIVSFYYLNENYKQAIQIGENILESKVLPTEIEITIRHNLSLAYRKLCLYDKLFNTTEIELELEDKINDLNSKVKTTQMIGRAHFILGDFNKAKEYYITAINILDSLIQKERSLYDLRIKEMYKACYLHELAYILLYDRRIEEAKDYLLKCNKIYDKYNGYKDRFYGRFLYVSILYLTVSKDKNYDIEILFKKAIDESNTLYKKSLCIYYYSLYKYFVQKEVNTSISRVEEAINMLKDNNVESLIELNEYEAFYEYLTKESIRKQTDNPYIEDWIVYIKKFYKELEG